MWNHSTVTSVPPSKLHGKMQLSMNPQETESVSHQVQKYNVILQNESMLAVVLLWLVQDGSLNRTGTVQIKGQGLGPLNLMSTFLAGDSIR